MTTTSMSADDGSLFATLHGIPTVDFPSNLQTALSGGRRMSCILSEVIALRRGTGKLTPNEYFYYRPLGAAPIQGGQAQIRREAGATANAHRLQQHRLVCDGGR